MEQQTRARMSVALACLAVALAGCSSDSNFDFSQFYRYGRQAFSQSDSVTLEQAAAIPYATIGVRLGDGHETLLALATDDGAGQMWTSAAHIAIVLRKGRIVRTVGFAHDLTSLTEEPRPDGDPETAAFTADYADDAIYGARIACKVVRREPETIEILGAQLSTTRIEEACSRPSDGWQFTNMFWRDNNSDVVWKSVQYVHPEVDPVTIEILRPPQMKTHPAP